MSEVTPLAELLAEEFLVQGHEWHLNDKTTFIPEAEHLQAMLDRIEHRLYDGNDTNAGAVEVGRLYVKKSDDKPDVLDVYLWMGDIQHGSTSD